MRRVDDNACRAWGLLMQFSFAQRGQLPSCAAQLGLSPVQCHVLHLIEPGKPLPMSRLAREGTKALSDSAQAQDGTIYVMCHHGNRSAQVTAWLTQQGWKNVFNVKGGIDEYARKIDPTVGIY